MIQFYSMVNSTKSWQILFVRVLIGITTFIGIFLISLLILDSANTKFFERYYSWLHALNWIIALLLFFIFTSLVIKILIHLHQKRFCIRLLAKIAIYFALVGILPGGLIYLVSLQFASRNIENLFDINIEKAQGSSMHPGCGMFEDVLSNLYRCACSMTKQLAQIGGSDMRIDLSRLRNQYGIQDASIISSSTSRGMYELCHVYASPRSLCINNLPLIEILRKAREEGFKAISTTLLDSSNPKNILRLRVVLIIPLNNANLNDSENYLQLIQPFSLTMPLNAENMQHPYKEYQEKYFGTIRLRKMYVDTLTLALFFAILIGIIIAFTLGNQLAVPLFLLARGTEKVAREDLTPKREIKTNDELGILTQAFNTMTRQLSEARHAVEINRTALEQSKIYLESVLASITAGVFVCDCKFRLTTANPSAQRILKKSFDGYLNQPIDQILGIEKFAVLIRTAFAECDARRDINQGDYRNVHWQQQIAIALEGEFEALTLLVRGTRLLNSSENKAVAGYVVVFDDISDLISAQRSVAWGEVARRLAHEIKNPLTPIQLSAERIQMKLEKKLNYSDAEVLRKGAKTIVNQVTAMKRMVDDFREYARTPPAILHDLQLNELITEMLALYGVEENKGMIKVQLQDLPIIKGDATQLRQIIHNLLQNAQDAVLDSKSPYVLVETRTVEYGDTNFDGYRRLAVRLLIEDNGPGFPIRILTRAFEPYVTTKPKGTGLGLAMVKKIVDEHGARIDIRNRMLPNSDKIVGAQVSILFLQMGNVTEKCSHKR